MNCVRMGCSEKTGNVGCSEETGRVRCFVGQINIRQNVGEIEMADSFVRAGCVYSLCFDLDFEDL